MVIQSITRDAETGDTAECSYYATGGGKLHEVPQYSIKECVLPFEGAVNGQDVTMV